LNVLEEHIEHYVFLTLSQAAEDWKGLQNYTDQLLGDGTEIFDPKLHDSLLFDDELFSISRKYFWLMNSMSEFDKRIQQNIDAWESFMSDHPTHGETEACQRVVDEMKRIKLTFKEQHG
jgi:hypothetical protein